MADDEPDLPNPSAGAALPQPADRRFRRRLRLGLLVGVPALVLVAGAYLYLSGGRYVGTDDAYVKADRVMVSADVSGRVVEVPVHENELVAAGEILFRLDDAPFKIALARAEARLASVRNDVLADEASYRQKGAELGQVQADVTFATREYKRQSDLAPRGAASQVNVDDARHALDAAQQKVLSIQQEQNAILAKLDGNPDLPPERHPLYLEAKAERDQAALDLSHAMVRAPAAGIVGPLAGFHPGNYLNAGTAAFTLVESGTAYIEANIKEDELTHVRPGQKATVTIDSYPGHQFPATVTSLSPASGAEFSILPAQNATGNWVKVVQRIPVRLAIDLGTTKMPLRAGMSANVEIDTGRTHGISSLLTSAIAGTGAESEDEP